MGADNSSLTPLNCILKNWDRVDPQGLKKTYLVFLCDAGWPQYQLEDGGWWPAGGSLKYNTVLQLDQFCRKQGKWVEVAYCVAIFSLRNMPDLVPKGIDLGVKSLALSYPHILLDEMEDRRQRDKEKQVSPIYPWDHIYRAARKTEQQQHKLLPLHEAPTGRNNQSMRVNKLFSYQEIKKKNQGGYARLFRGPRKIYLRF